MSALTLFETFPLEISGHEISRPEPLAGEPPRPWFPKEGAKDLGRQGIGYHGRPHANQSTATCTTNGKRVFRVTHPFHPWFNKEFEYLTVRNNQGLNRVMFIGSSGYMQSMPVAWTDLAPVDPFVELAGGRVLFRTADLLALVHLVQTLKEEV
ncbi:MAG: DUF5372 family protein [Peptococcaceae bacterium]|nr:DUF5372 family protein [Peptococcaceae bacterium]